MVECEICGKTVNDDIDEVAHCSNRKCNKLMCRDCIGYANTSDDYCSFNCIIIDKGIDGATREHVIWGG